MMVFHSLAFHLTSNIPLCYDVFILLISCFLMFLIVSHIYDMLMLTSTNVCDDDS